MNVVCLAPSEDLDYAPIFEQVLNASVTADLTLDTYYPHRGDLPSSPGADKILITGSEFHVYDRQDWVEQTEDFVMNALEAGIPVLGVCYGHQLLADTIGGTVGNVDAPDQDPLIDREMGFNTITLTDTGAASTLFDGFPQQFRSFTSHADRVTALPDNAVTLATNAYGNHGFTSTEYPAYGIQFHPEYGLDLAQQLLDEKDLTTEQRNAVEATMTEENAAEAKESRTVFDNFFTYM